MGRDLIQHSQESGEDDGFERRIQQLWSSVEVTEVDGGQAFEQEDDDDA